MKIHKSEKSFACEECNKAFSRLDNLRKHLLTHKKNLVPTHTCPECDQAFMKKYNLLQHQRTIHRTKTLKNIMKKQSIIKNNRKHKEALNVFRSFYFYPIEDTEKDIDFFLESNYRDICETLQGEIQEKKSIKWHIILKAEFVKTIDDEVKERASFYFTTPCQNQLTDEILSENIYLAFNKIKKNIDEFINLGSNWVLNKIELLEVKSAKYIPLRGGKFIQTPDKLKFKKALINVQNPDDDKCFDWALLAHKLKIQRNAEKISNYIPHEEKIILNDVT